jgi:hypothetical protein
MESNHFKGDGLHPKVGWIPKCDRQVDVPERFGLLPRHDAMERCSSRSDARSVDAHGVEHLNVHDVEAAASVHQHLGESLRTDDRVNHERVPAQMQDALRVVGSVGGDGGPRPLEEGGHGQLSHVDLERASFWRRLES